MRARQSKPEARTVETCPEKIEKISGGLRAPQSSFFFQKFRGNPEIREGELRVPLPHQQDALNWAASRDRIALFMEMRLGKTLTTIRWAQTKGNPRQRRILIVAPLTVLRSWYDELLKENINPKDIHLLRGTKAQVAELSNPFLKEAGWFLVNYEQLRARPELFKQYWKVVILDESTKIRNPKAQITRLCIKGFEYVPFKAILSGLPAPESPLDYHQQFCFLQGNFMGQDNWWKFRHRYFAVGWNDWDWIPKRGTLDAIKYFLSQNAFVLTRGQVKIGGKKFHESRYLYMTPEQTKMYRQVEKDYECGKEATKWAPVKFMWMSRIAGGFHPKDLNCLSSAKADEVINLLKGELKNDKVVIWFRFIRELEHAGKCLGRASIDSRTIIGATPFQERQRSLDEFRKDANVRALLVQFKCGKFGMDLSVASTAIYYSNSYEMEDRAQSEDRIVHPTRTDPLLLIDLITKNTVDEDVLQALQEKKVSARLFEERILKNYLARRKRKNDRAI